MSLTRRTTIVAKGRLTDSGRITTGAPVTAKSTGAVAVDTLTDVTVVESADGATLQYNEADGRYEVKPLEIQNLAGTLDLDLGTF